MPLIDPSRLRGIVFDMDGLLLDTEAIFKKAWQGAAHEEGHDMSDELFLSLIGRTREDSNKILRKALGEGFDLEKFQQLTEKHGQRVVAEEGISLKTGAERILAWARDHELACAVATSTYGEEASKRLETTGLIEHFRSIISGDMVSQGKPNPEIYLKAAEALSLPPASCLALEDSHPGVRSAHAAGMIVATVPDLIPPTREIRDLTEGRVYATLDDVVEALEGWVPVTG